MGGMKALNPSDGPLSGKLSGEGCLRGKISIAKEYGVYAGEYVVTPQAFKPQILETADRVLAGNIVVSGIPYLEVGNEADGVTAYIAKGVEDCGD